MSQIRRTPVTVVPQLIPKPLGGVAPLQNVGGGGAPAPPDPPSLPPPMSTVLGPQAQAQALSALDAALHGMVKLGSTGDATDLHIFGTHLGALNDKMLRALQTAGYQLNVARYRLSNADAELKDVTASSGGAGAFLVDLAEGVHKTKTGEKPSISVRTYFVDGVLRLDASTLLHEIGHAFDAVVGAPGNSSALNTRLRSSGPLNVEKDYVDAFTAEHQRLPQYFHTQSEFFAETFGLFMLDPVRCKRQFPLAFAAHEKRFANIAPDGAKLLGLEQTFDRAAVVTPSGPDLRQQLALLAQQGRLMRANNMPVMPTVIHLEGKADWGAESYVKDAARQVRNSFGKDAGVHRSTENFVKVSAATFNDAAAMEKLLTEIEVSGRAAVLYVDELAPLQKSSAGFQVMEDFAARHRDLPPLVLAGERTALTSLDGAIATAMRLPSKIEALNATQQVSLVERMAAQEACVLEAGVSSALATKLKGGGYEDAAAGWRSLRLAQFERHMAAGGAKTVAELQAITLADVGAMKVSSKKTPQERLDAMLGQTAAKTQIQAITDQAKVEAMRTAQGLPSPDPLRLNLLFAGAPGTGKTTFAEILGALLQETGYIKNPQVTKVTIQDLISGGSPEAAVKNLFEKNRGGVIFIDEMHQLKDTQEGQRAYRALIPYMTDAAYADTVFIGAGYSEELGDLIRNVDKGGERRFTRVDFSDYSKPELAAILDNKVKDLHLTLDPAARDAGLAFLEYKRRVTKNFGNAGEVDVALNHARAAQTRRLAQLDPKTVTPAKLQALTAEDFALPRPITKAEFWAEMDQMSGWSDIKAELKTMAAAIEGAERRGKPPTSAVEPYWIVDGPPGTGKSTLARMLAKFGAAYGLTAMPEVVEAQGANFQGQFVGQTANAVQQQFEKAWGRLLFVDEVSGLAKSGGTYKDEAAKMILAQTENHRGKFMMVVADYAENINLFLKLDPGIARRFGKRITLQPWTPKEALADLEKKLGADGVTIKAHAAAIQKHLTTLAATPGYASGGDVRTLHGAIMAALDAAPVGTNAAKVLPKAIDEAFKALIDKKKKDAGPATARVDDGTAVDVAHAVAVATVAKPLPSTGLTAADERVIAAMDAVNQKFAKQLNGLTPAQLEQIMNDPKSDYVKELAKALGVKEAEAVKTATMVRVKVKKLVQKQEIMKRFQYHCPFCGGIDSPTCGYINQPLDWKIQHSLKKPWNEVKITTEEVEVIEERPLEPG